MTRSSEKAAYHKKHVVRFVGDRWVCSGGVRHDRGVRFGPRCDFSSESYADAVTHSTEWGSNPPDMPPGSWTSA